MWMSIILIGLLIGTVFGFFLERAGVLNPDVIVGQFQWRRFTMLRVFSSAIITGLSIYWVLDTLGFGHLNWKCTKIYLDLLGGGLLGIGVALAGSCPGTVLGQVGLGYKDAWMTVLGGLAGAWTYLHTKDHVIALLGDWPNEVVMVPQVLGISLHTTTAIFIVAFSLFLFLTRKLPA